MSKSTLDSYTYPPVTNSSLQYANIPSNQAPLGYYTSTKYDAPPQMQHPMPSYATSSLYAGGPVQQPQPPAHSHYSQLSNPMPIRASSGAWTPQDDQTLMQARAQGMNWQPIQQAYFPGKTPNACRKRHERLMERRSGEDWDGVKHEKFAHGYMQMRREIWQGLANLTGEKWNVVEQKCMSSGLKNLQTAARSYARRERMLDANSGLYGDNGSSSHPDDLSIDEFGSDDQQNANSNNSHNSTSSSNGAQQSNYPDPEASAPGQPHHSQPPQSHGSSNHSAPDPRFVHPGLAASQHNSGREDRIGVQNALAQFGATGRLPSMDMGIDAIINRPSGR